MVQPSLNLQKLREKFSSHIFERGGRYQQSGEVLDLTLRGHTVLAGVQGSDDEPYRVTLELSENDLLNAQCSCPYSDNFGGWCKHIAAVALEYIHRPDMVMTEPSVAELLSPLDAETLRGALSHLLELYPEATSKLELYLQKTALREASVGAAGPRAKDETADGQPATLDTRLFEKMMQSAVRGARHDWDGFPEYDEVYEVIGEIKPFLERGDYQGALTLTEALVRTFIDEVESRDEDGNIGFSDEGLFLDFDTHFAEAVLGSALSEDERKRLLREVLAWHDRIANDWTSPDLNMTAHALAEGLPNRDEETEELLSEVAGLELYGGNYAQIRLRVLRATGQNDEALAFAKATEQGATYLAVLVDQDELQSVMEEYQDHIKDEQGALNVAELLAADHPEEALEVARYGLAQGARAAPEDGYRPTGERLALATFTKVLALRLARHEAVLEASLTEFKLEPSLARYRALRDLVGEVKGSDWPTVRAEVLAGLRQASYPNHHAAADIFLAEALPDDAVAIASTFPGAGGLLHKVMTAVMDTHAQWVVDTAREQAEPIMDEGRSGKYDRAATWLGYVKQAYGASGRDAQWQAYIAEVRETHGRKYKLMRELKSL